jgi:hypothetical protein
MWTHQQVQAVNEALMWTQNFLGSKFEAGLGLKSGLRIGSGEASSSGTSGEAHPHTTGSAILLRMDNDYNNVRNAAIHEFGHFVDYFAGVAIGVSPAWTAGKWVQEWQYVEPYNWLYIGPDPNGVPSNYVLETNATKCIRQQCPGEDFADTFAWMVYDSQGRQLTSGNNWTYRVPSLERQDAVRQAIGDLP